MRSVARPGRKGVSSPPTQPSKHGKGTGKKRRGEDAEARTPTRGRVNTRRSSRVRKAAGGAPSPTPPLSSSSVVNFPGDKEKSHVHGVARERGGSNTDMIETPKSSGMGRARTNVTEDVRGGETQVAERQEAGDTMDDDQETREGEPCEQGKGVAVVAASRAAHDGSSLSEPEEETEQHAQAEEDGFFDWFGMGDSQQNLITEDDREADNRSSCDGSDSGNISGSLEKGAHDIRHASPAHSRISRVPVRSRVLTQIETSDDDLQLGQTTAETAVGRRTELGKETEPEARLDGTEPKYRGDNIEPEERKVLGDTGGESSSGGDIRLSPRSGAAELTMRTTGAESRQAKMVPSPPIEAELERSTSDDPEETSASKPRKKAEGTTAGRRDRRKEPNSKGKDPELSLVSSCAKDIEVRPVRKRKSRSTRSDLSSSRQSSVRHEESRSDAVEAWKAWEDAAIHEEEYYPGEEEESEHKYEENSEGSESETSESDDSGSGTSRRGVRKGRQQRKYRQPRRKRAKHEVLGI